VDEDQPKLELSEQDQSYLLKIARQVILAKCQNSKLGLEVPKATILHEKRGAFVTLNKHDQLRGCLGFVEGFKPLYQTITEMAEAAAFEDPRFPKVQLNEVEDLKIEISVLTPLDLIQDIDQIKVGIHGLLIKKGNYQGLLLPQVATHYNWDRYTFLNQTCLKAGLQIDSWRDSNVEIYIFSAQIFSESD